MRPRAVGGLEPDERDQHELSELWHLSRTGLATAADQSRGARIDWVVDMFLREHPDAGRKWVYVWCEAQLGRLTYGEPVAVPPHLDRERPVTPRRPRRRRTRT